LARARTVLGESPGTRRIIRYFALYRRSARWLFAVSREPSWAVVL